MRVLHSYRTFLALLMILQIIIVPFVHADPTPEQFKIGISPIIDDDLDPESIEIAQGVVHILSDQFNLEVIENARIEEGSERKETPSERRSKQDKIILIDADSVSATKAVVVLQVVDAQGGVKQSPLSFTFLKIKPIREKVLNDVVAALLNQISPDIVGNPSARKNHKKLTKKPIFWIVLGSVVLGGVLAGILMSGGGSQSSPESQDGKIRLKIE